MNKSKKNSEWDKWTEDRHDNYKFSLRLSTKERKILEEICLHQNTTKTLFLRKQISAVYKKIKRQEVKQ